MAVGRHLHIVINEGFSQGLVPHGPRDADASDGGGYDLGSGSVDIFPGDSNVQ